MLSQSSSALSRKLQPGDKFSEYEKELHECWDRYANLSADLRLDRANPGKNKKWNDDAANTFKLMDKIMTDLTEHNNRDMDKFSSNHIRLYVKAFALSLKSGRKIVELEKPGGRLSDHDNSLLAIAFYLYANSGYKSIFIKDDMYAQNALEVIFSFWLKSTQNITWVQATQEVSVRYLKMAIAECTNPAIKLQLYHYLYFVSAKFSIKYLGEFQSTVSDFRVTLEAFRSSLKADSKQTVADKIVTKIENACLLIYAYQASWVHSLVSKKHDLTKTKKLFFTDESSALVHKTISGNELKKHYASQAFDTLFLDNQQKCSIIIAPKMLNAVTEDQLADFIAHDKDYEMLLRDAYQLLKGISVKHRVVVKDGETFSHAMDMLSYFVSERAGIYHALSINPELINKYKNSLITTCGLATTFSKEISKLIEEYHGALKVHVANEAKVDPTLSPSTTSAMIDLLAQQNKIFLENNAKRMRKLIDSWDEKIKAANNALEELSASIALSEERRVAKEKAAADKRRKVEMSSSSQSVAELVNEKNESESESESDEDGPVVVDVANIKYDPLKNLNFLDEKFSQAIRNLGGRLKSVLSILNRRMRSEDTDQAIDMHTLETDLKASLFDFKAILDLVSRYQALSRSLSLAAEQKEEIDKTIVFVNTQVESLRRLLNECQCRIDDIRELSELSFEKYINMNGMAEAKKLDKDEFAALTAEDIYWMGYEKYIEAGRERARKGLPISDRALERKAFNAIAEQFTKNLKSMSNIVGQENSAMTDKSAKRGMSAESSKTVTEELSKAEAGKADIVIPTIQVTYPDVINELLRMLSVIPGEIRIRGSSLIDFIEGRIPNPKTTDIDIVITSDDPRPLYHLGFSKSLISNQKLYQSVFKGYKVDISVIDRQLVSLGEEKMWAAISYSSYATVCSLLGDLHGTISDWTGSGLRDIRSRVLCAPHENQLGVAEDPARIPKLVKRMLKFKPTSSTGHQLFRWVPTSNMNLNHIWSIVRSHLEGMKDNVSNQLRYVRIIADLGHLQDLFGIDDQYASDSDMDILNRIKAVVDIRVEAHYSNSFYKGNR